jgi:hypothetical protein
VWRDVPVNSGSLRSRGKRLANRCDRLAIPFNYRMAGYPQPLPSPQMGEQACRKPYGRLPLVSLGFSLASAVENAAFQIDVAAADRGIERCRANRRMARASVEADQHEPGYVTPDIPVGDTFDHLLLCTPRSPDKPGSLRSSQPILSRCALFWQRHANHFGAKAFGPMVIDRRS